MNDAFYPLMQDDLIDLLDYFDALQVSAELPEALHEEAVRLRDRIFCAIAHSYGITSGNASDNFERNPVPHFPPREGMKIWTIQEARTRYGDDVADQIAVRLLDLGVPPSNLDLSGFSLTFFTVGGVKN